MTLIVGRRGPGSCGQRPSTSSKRLEAIVWEQSIGTFPVDFTEHGNEWAHHLGNAMGGGFRSISGTDSHGGPVEMGPPLDDSMTSILRGQPGLPRGDLAAAGPQERGQFTTIVIVRTLHTLHGARPTARTGES
ncbi:MULTISPECIES: hypothetical protein [unclassified Streptomyces]|uniref:hypothetical protein n=1 Tax=unclassified Streptomyces TaxID=2593676 RepID=UPI00341AD248